MKKWRKTRWVDWIEKIACEGLNWNYKVNWYEGVRLYWTIELQQQNQNNWTNKLEKIYKRVDQGIWRGVGIYNW